MAILTGAGVVSDGLIMAYDHDNTKSFAGAPTTNHAYLANARTDSSYASYEYDPDATWVANHADAITVYNDVGTNISNYVNIGQGLAASHAIWVYDEGLRRPVVIMRDWDGTWKAKSFSVGLSMTGMGLAATDQYTISWLQWTSDIAKSVNAGLYGDDNQGVPVKAFHDGLSNTVAPTTSFNTKVNTWQRVYATFTVVSTWDFTDVLSCYMYGHYGADGTVKIADVQIESLSYATGFSKAQTRSSTEAILDTTGNETITATSLTYDDHSFTFANSNLDYLSIADTSYPVDFDDPFTVEVWMYSPTGGVWYDSVTHGANSGTAIIGRGAFPGSHGLMRTPTDNLISWWLRSDTTITQAQTSITRDAWYHIVGTYDGTTQKVYNNGEYIASATPVWTLVTSMDAGVWNVCGNVAYGGANGGYSDGDVHVARIYNKALTADEVNHNFSAMRGRFGV